MRRVGRSLNIFLGVRFSNTNKLLEEVLVRIYADALGELGYRMLIGASYGLERYYRNVARISD